MLALIKGGASTELCFLLDTRVQSHDAKAPWETRSQRFNRPVSAKLLATVPDKKTFGCYYTSHTSFFLLYQRLGYLISVNIFQIEWPSHFITGCRINRAAGMTCSDLADACCHDCQVTTAAATVCNEPNECQEAAFCDGVTSKCPSTKSKADNSTCSDNTKVNK